jgi:hypothetical protein
MLTERALVPLGEVGVGLTEGTQDAAGDGERLAAEERRNRLGDLATELGGAIVHRLREDE